MTVFSVTVFSEDPEEQGFLAEMAGMTWDEGTAVVEEWAKGMKDVDGKVKSWEPVRQIVWAPDGRLWLLDAVEGRVERQILMDEIQGWSEFTDHKPVPAADGSALVFHPPSEYAGPSWEIHRKAWPQMAKLGRCTCEGVKPDAEHYAGCCLVTIAAGAHLMEPSGPVCTCGGLTDAAGEVIGHIAGCPLGDAMLALAEEEGLA